MQNTTDKSKRKKATKRQRELKRQFHAETFKSGFDTGFAAGLEIGYAQAIKEQNSKGVEYRYEPNINFE